MPKTVSNPLKPDLVFSTQDLQDMENWTGKQVAFVGNISILILEPFSLEVFRDGGPDSWWQYRIRDKGMQAPIAQEGWWSSLEVTQQKALEAYRELVNQMVTSLALYDYKFPGGNP